MNSTKEMFENMIDNIKKEKIIKPLDSYHDFETTIGEYYDDKIEEIKHDLEVLDILKGYEVSLYHIQNSKNWDDYTAICDKNTTLSYLSLEQYNKIKEWLEK